MFDQSPQNFIRKPTSLTNKADIESRNKYNKIVYEAKETPNEDMRDSTSKPGTTYHITSQDIKFQRKRVHNTLLILNTEKVSGLDDIPVLHFEKTAHPAHFSSKQTFSTLLWLDLPLMVGRMQSISKKCSKMQAIVQLPQYRYSARS